MAVSKPKHGYEWLPLLVLVALLGCQRSEVKVTVTDGAGYREVLKRHVGQVVLVDFWANW